MKRDDQKENSRRAFLRQTAAMGAGATAVVALPGVVVASEAEERQQSSEKKGYRLTRHIVDYYKTAAE